ncbi:hypothetical protein ANANG_G00139290 [Anguilla anguilla]|uniref:Uncharacterized protein n=1 Tax=Anguilla anguilla TaxID=7936 RepID=A0A9D3MDU3_ANGAN|nr:hypothetical protein ANANG_G00139290 [Anguilla anguilla]
MFVSSRLRVFTIGQKVNILSYKTKSFSDWSNILSFKPSGRRLLATVCLHLSNTFICIKR